jgi:diguanylate cyclase (GGDEF)-like protein/PAS domain S-box-containing protein
LLVRSSPALGALVRVLLDVDDAVEIHDADGICVFVNPAWVRLTGQRPDEVIGQPAPTLPARGVRRVLLADEAGRRSHSVIFRREPPPTGKARPTERDARFDRAIRGASEGLWELELASGQLLLSPRCLELVDFPSQETTLTQAKELAHPDDVARILEGMRGPAAIAGGKMADELRMRDRDGRWRWLLVRAMIFCGPDGRPERVAGGLSDIQDRKDAEENLVLLASRDPLTNLLNRRVFVERMEQAARRAHRGVTANFAVLYVDLRKFEQVNDQHGHEVGDDLLRSVATRLLAAVRPGDTVARLGGDEFGVLLEPVGNEHHMIAAAQRVERALAVPFPLGPLTVHISGTIGAVMGDTSGNIDALIRDADTAMYYARAEGNAGHKVADTEMRARIQRRAAIASLLPAALRRNGLRVLFQPIVELGSRRTVGWRRSFVGNTPTWAR